MSHSIVSDRREKWLRSGREPQEMDVGRGPGRSSEIFIHKTHGLGTCVCVCWCRGAESVKVAGKST